jgi:alanine racemase
MSLYTTPVLNINLKKIKENYLMLKDMAGKSIASAVVKDDAYGLGGVEVAKELYSVGCRHFFVAHALEGEKIFDCVKDVMIFVLQGIGEDSLDIFKKCKLIPVISSAEMFSFWKKNRIEGVKPVIQVETGLNRLGFGVKDLERLSDEELKEFSFVMSHLSSADEKEHFMNAKQLENFKYIKERFFKKTKASLSASDGVFLGKEYHFDMVRLGAGMYGINTAPYRISEMKNVIEVKAPILQIKTIDKGEYVGYSATYKAQSKMKIATVSIGYGDGIFRTLSNKRKVLFYENKKPKVCPIIGRVSMDNIIVDISNVKEMKVGDFVYVINDDYTLDDIARDAGTIAYEVVSSIGKGQRFIKSYKR